MPLTFSPISGAEAEIRLAERKRHFRALFETVGYNDRVGKGWHRPMSRRQAVLMAVVGAIIGLASGLVGMNYSGTGSKVLELLALVAFIYVVIDTRRQRRRRGGPPPS